MIDNSNPQRGFIALMSTIVISAILLLLMAGAGLASFYARYDALGIESKHAAHALAEACVNVALLALATSTDPLRYAPNNQKINVGTDTWGNEMRCIIKNVIPSGSDATINAYASTDGSFDTVSAVVSLSPSMQVISWGESQ